AEALRQTVLTPQQAREFDAAMQAPLPSPLARLIDFMRRHQLLPEAYLYGLANTLKYSEQRAAFLNGDISTRGWLLFFPYTFLVKTPLSVFMVIALALAIVAVDWYGGSPANPGRRQLAVFRGFYPTLPLWTLEVVYLMTIIFSHLNIGHRHMLPLYAPLFMLCGVSANWLRPGNGWGAGIPEQLKKLKRFAAAS